MTEGAPAGFDWPGLMRAGMAGLGLHPDQFWRLTPAELVVMLGDPAAVAPLGRSALDALRQAWPDPVAGRPRDTAKGE